MTLLEIDNAVVEYSISGKTKFRAVSGVSLDVAAGEVVGLVGESGCGKSSLGRAVVGLNPLTSGAVRMDGHQLSPLGRRARSQADRAVQMVFQDPYSSLNPRRRIGRQILDAMPAGTRDVDEKIGEALESVGLPRSAVRRFPHQFSGGQRQRIAIARALAAEPRVIVADEPVSALDASTKLQVASLLSDAAQVGGAGLLMISHDLSGLRLLADRIAVMYFGRIVEMGPTADIWEHSMHPYTRGLIGAIPRLGRGAKLPAEPPRDLCNRDASPEESALIEVTPGHWVATEALS